MNCDRTIIRKTDLHTIGVCSRRDHQVCGDSIPLFLKGSARLTYFNIGVSQAVVSHFYM
jgi:hypothetical protein